MRKVLALGSICAVLILVFASLSPVVGNQKIFSSSNENPLFENRISIATQHKSDKLNSLKSDFLGKEVETNIKFIKKISNNEIIQNLISDIINMENDEFNNYFNVFLNKINFFKMFDSFNKNEFISLLTELKNNPNYIKEIELRSQKEFLTLYPGCTMNIYYPCTIDNSWAPGCYLLMGFRFITVLFAIALVTIYLRFFQTSDLLCDV